MRTSAAVESPLRCARFGGLLYLVIIVAGATGELFIRGRVIVPRDAALTAHNILAAPFLWRVGIAGDLVMHICDVGLMLVLYVLLRPVSRNLALLAVLFNLVQTAVLVANKMTLLLPLFLLGSGDYLKAFSPEQLQALTYVSLRLHDYGFGFGLIFFGMECIVLGWLIARSKYLPRPIGLLMQLAGVCYLTNSFALILDPELGAIISGDSAAAVHRGIVACPVAASERRRAVEVGGAARAQKRVNVALIVRLTAFRSITSRRDDPGGPCIAS